MPLGQFHTLVIMNKAAVNVEMQISLPHTEFISFGKYLEVRLLCLMKATVFSFLRNFHSVFHNGFTKNSH